MVYYTEPMTSHHDHTHGHGHGHGHAHAHAHPARALDPSWSLLRLSAGARLGGAVALCALLWLATILVIA